MPTTKSRSSKRTPSAVTDVTESAGIAKAPTGIAGLDDITNGGLPAGRPTLICGTAGSGKTMLAIEFLVNGAVHYGEPGIFMMFEESAEELTQNVRSLGMDLDRLVADGKVGLEHVHVERSEIEETGEYDLEGLFIRLGHAVDTIGAKRVVLDTLEALFAGLPNHAILRAELRRLFRWLKDRGLTAIITGERGEASLTRYGLEEYVADCVILLDHRIEDQISTRRMRVVKYRGTEHGTNEYPFLIGRNGFSVLPITSLRLDHEVSTEVVSSGIPQLDAMFGNGGFYRGTSVLVTGSPGTGKSSVASAFVAAACARGEKALLFAFEESADQLIRNMRSVGIDLAQWVKSGLLQIHASRPTLYGHEQHLLIMHDTINAFQPSVVAIDPISNMGEAEDGSVQPMMMRLIDYLKQQQITALFVSLTTPADERNDQTTVGVSSLMDTWLQLRNIEHNGERNRTIFILKSRGTNHSNQVREFLLTPHGLEVIEPYIGLNQVYTGTARVAQEMQDRVAADLKVQSGERRVRDAMARRKALEAQIAALQAQAEADAAELEFIVAEQELEKRTKNQGALTMSQARSGSGRTTAHTNGKPGGDR
jgi:circadian clock protein KaiC